MELVLPDTKTYVFTIPRNAQRQARVRQQLGTLGFRDWDFVMGRTGEGDYWRHIREDFVRVLLQPGRILILEDDIETLPENYQASITLPDDTDVCYLGGGIVGSPVGGLFARRMHGDVQYMEEDRGGTAAYRELDSDWLRVMSMFFTHAVLFVTESAKRAFCEAILDNPNDAVDVAQSLIQHRWNCILRKRPFWYQNDRHAHETRCYYDPAQSTDSLVTTFYDPVAGMADLALLDKWRKNWTANGWRVRIVTLADAQRVDPKRLCMFKSDAFYVGNKTMSREYLFRCYARWLSAPAAFP